MNSSHTLVAADGTRQHESPQRWWTSPFQMFQTNLRQVDAGMDVERVLDYIEQFGANTWLVNAGGILSFYPSDLPFQTRNPYLSQRNSGDLLGDAVEAAHARGIRLMARMDFSKVSAAIADEHPEWCFIAPDGSLQVYNGLVSVCPSAGYYQEKIFEILDEVIDRYPVDGFFINWFSFNEVDYSGQYRGVSQNPAARRAFAQFSGGQDLPVGPESPNYDLWRQYSAGVVRDLASRIRAHIGARRPDACLILRHAADVVFHEANNAVGRELWHHATSEAVSAIRSRRPQSPVLVNAVAFIDMPYRMASEQPEHFAQYLLQTISRGANPSTYIMGLPGDIPYEDLEIASRITRFHADWSALYRGLRPTAPVGLVRPDPLAPNLDRQAESTAEFQGLYAALQQKHVTFDVVPLEGLADMREDGGLQRYAVLVLPDLTGITPDVATALDAFVADGGRLVTTGASGFTEQGTSVLDSLPADRILASIADPEALKATYVVPEGGTDGVRFTGPVVPVYGAYHDIEAREGVEPHLHFLPQARFGPPELAYGHEPDGQPGYLVRTYGSGSVAQIPWTAGRTYHHLGLTTVRDLVVGLVMELLGDDWSVCATLPEQAEITVQRSESALVIHVLNLSGARRKNFGPELPITGGTLQLRGVARGATAVSLVSGAECDLRFEGDEMWVSLPEIGLFDVIAVQNPHAEPAR